MLDFDLSQRADSKRERRSIRSREGVEPPMLRAAAQ
jgi:hypothetical protein